MAHRLLAFIIDNYKISCDFSEVMTLGKGIIVNTDMSKPNYKSKQKENLFKKNCLSLSFL